jgi:hypothetical protein
MLYVFFWVIPRRLNFTCQMRKSQSLFYLTTALHVPSVTITHLQEHKTTATTASGNRYTLPVAGCCGRSRFVLLKMGDGDAWDM